MSSSKQQPNGEEFWPAVGSCCWLLAQSNLSPMLDVEGGGRGGESLFREKPWVPPSHALGVVPDLVQVPFLWVVPKPVWGKGPVQVPSHRERLESCLLFQPGGNCCQIRRALFWHDFVISNPEMLIICAFWSRDVNNLPGLSFLNGVIFSKEAKPFIRNRPFNPKCFMPGPNQVAFPFGPKNFDWRTDTFNFRC